MRKFLIQILLIIISTSAFTMTIDIVDINNGNSINKSILSARSGDTLIVKTGIYQEANIIINKPLTILGEKNAVIDGAERGQILTIKADHVTISGLEFRNTPISYIKDNAAIKLDSANYCTIINNSFVNNFFAIYLARSSKCKIINNKISSQSKRETASGNGIHLWYCKDITVEGNTVFAHRDGIYFEFVEDSFIKNNLSENNLRYGLHFMFSNRCSYTQNIFRNN